MIKMVWLLFVMPAIWRIRLGPNEIYARAFATARLYWFRDPVWYYRSRDDFGVRVSSISTTRIPSSNTMGRYQWITGSPIGKEGTFFHWSGVLPQRTAQGALFLVVTF